MQIRNIKKDRKLIVKGGTVIDGFPSGGLVNAIASEFLIRTVGMELVGVVDSAEFPALSIITNSIPQFPARLYVNEDLKLAIFISELNIFPEMQKDMANAILVWSVEHQCKKIPEIHGFRKFYSTQLVNAGLNTEKRWMLEGHSLKNNDYSYVKPSVQELYNEYSKAINLLTIDPANRLQMEVDDLKDEKDAQITELTKKIKLLEDNTVDLDYIKTLTKRLAELERRSKRIVKIIGQR